METPGDGSPRFMRQALRVTCSRLVRIRALIQPEAYPSTYLAPLSGLLGCRIWYIDHKAANSRGHSSGYPLRQTLRIIIDAALIYRFTLLVALIAFVRQSNGQFVIVNLVSYHPLLAYYENRPTEFF